MDWPANWLFSYISSQIYVPEGLPTKVCCSLIANLYIYSIVKYVAYYKIKNISKPFHLALSAFNRGLLSFRCKNCGPKEC